MSVVFLFYDRAVHIDLYTDIERIFNSYSDLVFRVARKYFAAATAEDVVQDVFIKLCHSSIDLHNDAYVRNWLIKVTANHCKTMIRDKKRHPVVALDEKHLAQQELMRLKEDEAKESANRLFSSVAHAVERLPFLSRRLMKLRFEEGLGVKEISKITGLSETAVYVQLHRARKNLKKIVGDVDQ